MSDHYHSHIFTLPDHDGWAFESRLYHDSDLGPPWEERETAGRVRELHAPRYRSGHSHTTGKRPGERILDWTDCRGFAYDWAGAVAEFRLEECMTGPDAVAAANAEFARLRGWLRGDWHWCGAEVRVIKCPPRFKRCLDDQDDLARSCWGIESTAADYLVEVAKELAEDAVSAAKKAVLAYEEAHPACPCCGQRSPLAGRAGLGEQVEDTGDDVQDNREGDAE
jgi:hypothetical protein